MFLQLQLGRLPLDCNGTHARTTEYGGFGPRPRATAAGVDVGVAVAADAGPVLGRVSAPGDARIAAPRADSARWRALRKR